VEVLPDLAAYRDLVVALAAELFRRDHPGRRKLPNNFADGFQLKVATIEPGSAIPCLERVVPTGGHLLPDAKYFDRAQSLLHRTMEAAQDDGPIRLPDDFPRPLLGRFNTLGRALRDGECIRWSVGVDKAGPQYDRQVRKRLVLQTAQTYEQDVDLVGTVTGHEWAWPKGATEGKLLLDLEGRQVALVFHPELVATVRTILGSDEPLVRFTGTGVFDSNDRLLRVIATHSLDLVESAEPPQDAARSRILSELEGLAQLKPGWLDGEGTAYAPALLDTARALLFALLDRSVPAPCVLPTPEGEVRLEWSPATPYDVSACLDADGAQVYLHSSPGLMDEFDECTLACSDHEAIVAFLQTHGVQKQAAP
jgi:hypothetical protein